MNKLVRRIMRLRDEGMRYRDIDVVLGLDVLGMRSYRVMRRVLRHIR